MAIIGAYYPEKLSESQGWFVAESTGGIISANISLALDDNDKKEAKAPGIVAWLADPANIIEPYQITLQEARQNFRQSLDAATQLTYNEIRDSDRYYDGVDPDYFLEIWPEFFEFQRWHDAGKVGTRPATPKMDFYAQILADEVNDASFSLGNARGRLRGQLAFSNANYNRRFNIMIEEIDSTTGDLLSYRLRQPGYIDMQKEAKQYRYQQINSSGALTDEQKADQIQALAETMTTVSGEAKPLKLDNDPANPRVPM